MYIWLSTAVKLSSAEGVDGVIDVAQSREERVMKGRPESSITERASVAVSLAIDDMVSF
jgi:hypothetical protein